MSAPSAAHIEYACTEIIKHAPDLTVEHTVPEMAELPEVPLTYGSWMELGLAARQMLAAADQLDVSAAPATCGG